MLRLAWFATTWLGIVTSQNVHVSFLCLGVLSEFALIWRLLRTSVKSGLVQSLNLSVK